MPYKIILINALVLFIFMSLAFLVARSRRRIDTVDVCWGLGFVLVAWSVMVQAPTGRSLLVAILVTIWGLRLALHIHHRHKGKGDDPRYAEITKKWKVDNIWPKAYVSIYLLQGVLVLAVSLPIVMISNFELDGWYWLVVTGALIWLVGFVIEVVADRQLQRFLRLKNRPKVLQTGLWHYSRHPNYFGELMQWWGIGTMALSVSYGWVGLLGPLLLTYLMIFVSGIPPIEKRRLKDREYQDYKNRTSPIVLWPPKK